MSRSTFQRNLTKVQEITRNAAGRVDELVFSFGHLEVNSPEREILEIKVREILSDWFDQVWDCGGEPQDLWAVTFRTSEGEFRWQYPCSRFIESFSSNS